MPNRHVVRNPKDGWSVKVPNEPTPESNHPTQEVAEEAATRAVRREGGGQVIVHRPDGSIRDADTVPPAKDPFPPRDRR